MNDWIVWVVVGLVLLILEMLLPGVFMMWLGLAAIGTGLLTLGLGFAFAAQVVSFGLLTVAALAVGMRFRRPRDAGKPMRNESAGLVDRRATALVFQGRDGRVRLGDTDWPARVPADIDPPDPGARMKVERVDGTILIVRPDI